MSFRVYVTTALLLVCSYSHSDSPKSPRAETGALSFHYEQLKELNWLVGNWVNDTSSDMTVHSTYRWDTGKNFLLQSFKMTSPEQKELSGEQIIGWDPIEKTICSWIFDSDGGFGKSTWTKQENSWYATTIFTLFDGRRASATHVYTKVNENTYTFSSQNRDIDGKVLPNIGPFKAMKR